MAEKEAASRCPVCGQPVRAARLEGHMRKAHPPLPAAPRRAPPAFRLSRRGKLLAAAVVVMLVAAGSAYYVFGNRPSPAPPGAPVTPVDSRTKPTAWVSMETDFGGMLVALYGNATPVTVRHFLELAEMDFYNGTIFHIAVKDQLVVGGGYLTNLSQKLIPIDPGTGKLPTIPLEINPVMKNTLGTVGMIHNSTDPDTAVSEFYINLADNPSLDRSATSPGFSVFGQVLSGFNVAQEIGNLTTSEQSTPDGRTLGRVPVKHVVINHVVVLTSDR